MLLFIRMGISNRVKFQIYAPTKNFLTRYMYERYCFISINNLLLNRLPLRRHTVVRSNARARNAYCCYGSVWDPENIDEKNS